MVHGFITPPAPLILRGGIGFEIKRSPRYMVSTPRGKDCGLRGVLGRLDVAGELFSALLLLRQDVAERNAIFPQDFAAIAFPKVLCRPLYILGLERSPM